VYIIRFAHKVSVNSRRGIFQRERWRQWTTASAPLDAGYNGGGGPGRGRFGTTSLLPLLLLLRGPRPGACLATL
jgi:hypothetical protein